MPGTRKSKPARSFKREILAVVLVLALWSVSAVLFFYHKGFLLYYGDAESHLNIARRVIDSRTPGFDQLGTVWLPLPHVLMLPFVHNDFLWQTGLAGAIPSSMCFIAAGVLLFASARRIFNSSAIGAAAAAIFALNPNLLYLQSTPMTEPVFLAALMALLYGSVRFQQTQSLASVFGAGLALLAGTLTRYEGWFLIPFTTLFFLFAAKRNRFAVSILFGAVASLGPLFWFAYNWWYFGDFLEFYTGPYSPRAIQGAAKYPGYGNWSEALHYLSEAARLCAGAPLWWMGVGGTVLALARRKIWPVVLLSLPAVFYLWSMHSSGGSPIHVPNLPPHSYYNTRYGLIFLPLAALGGATLATLLRNKTQAVAAVALVAIAAAPWLVQPYKEAWVTWKESKVNSEARRAWTQQAADFLAPRYRRGEGIFTSSGDVMAIFRRSGIPIRQTLTIDNEPHWQAAVARPDLFLWEDWAVAVDGDRIQKAIQKSKARGPRYSLIKKIVTPRAPAIEIYRRDRPAESK